MEEREAIKCIRDELCRFAIVTEPAKTTFGKVRALAAAPPCHHRAFHETLPYLRHTLILYHSPSHVS